MALDKDQVRSGPATTGSEPPPPPPPPLLLEASYFACHSMTGDGEGADEEEEDDEKDMTAYPRLTFDGALSSIRI